MEKVVCNIKKIFWSNEKRILIFLFILICFFRIWLLYSSNWYINIDTYYDSHLQINQAVSIVSGNWLGSYSRFTLCKNPIYPIFLAILYVLHIPYAYGLGLLMIVTSLLFVKAIKPIIKSSWLKLFIFTFILYNPVARESTYHYRNAVLPWLVLAVIACVIAIYLRRNEKIKNIIPFSIIGMISMGSFWLLREDSIWLLPFVLCAYLVGIISLIIDKQKKKKIILYALVSFMPLFGIFAFNTAISLINYKCYGIYATNDRMQTNSAKVLGLLIRIDDGADLDDDVWISSEAIELAKEASPTFASLDLEAFDKWSKFGDHSIWAIRDVMTNSGYYIDAKETNSVYGKIVSELELAFKKGILKKKKGIQLSDTSGMFSYNEFFSSFRNAFDVTKYHITYEAIENGLENVVNYSSESDLHLYEELLGINILRNNEYVDTSNVSFNTQNENLLRGLYHNLFISNIILAFYQHTDVLLFIVATIGLLFVAYKAIKKDEKINCKVEFLIIMIGLLLLTYLNAFLVCVFATNFHPNLFNDIAYNYTTVEYLLITLYEMIGLVYFIELIKDFVANKDMIISKNSKKNLKKSKKEKRTNKSDFQEFIHILLSFNIKKIFKDETDNIYTQFFRYLFVGGFAAIVNVGMLYVFTDILHIYYVISNILSFLLGLLTNYVLSKKFIFQAETSISRSKEFAIYAIIGIIGLGIDTLLVWLFTDIISIYYIISKLISTGIVFIWNFGARKILYKIIK